MELRRTRVGDFSMHQMVTLNELESLDRPIDRERFVLPLDESLSHLPKISLPDNLAQYLCRGQAVKTSDQAIPGLVRLYAPTQGFLGLGEFQEDQRIQPKRLFVTV